MKEYKKKLLAGTLGTIAGLIIAWALLESTSGEGGPGAAVRRIVAMTIHADPGLLFAAFLLFTANVVLKAMRWLFLDVSGNSGFGVSMAVTSVHVGLAHLLPFRLGDLAFVAMFRRFGDVPVGYGTAGMVFSKFVDLIALGMVMSACMIFAPMESALSAPAAVFLGIAGILSLASVIGFLKRPMKWILSKLMPGDRTFWMDDLLKASSLEGRKKKIAAAIAISVLVWLAKLYMFSLILKAVGVKEIPTWKIFMAGGVMNLVMALPIHGLLNLGTTEAGWTAAFAMVGITGGNAAFDVVQVGFAVHIVWICMAVLLLLFGTAMLTGIFLKKKKERGVLG